MPGSGTETAIRAVESVAEGAQIGIGLRAALATVGRVLESSTELRDLLLKELGARSGQALACILSQPTVDLQLAEMAKKCAARMEDEPSATLALRAIAANQRFDDVRLGVVMEFKNGLGRTSLWVAQQVAEVLDGFARTRMTGFSDPKRCDELKIPHRSSSN